MTNISIRRPTEDDLPFIEDIAAKYENNPLPDKFVAAAVTEKYDDIIAFGVLRANVEALLYTDGDPKDKVESLKLLIEKSKSDAKTAGYNDIYVFAQDEEFAKILEKHFGFRRCVNKIAMILDL